MMRHLLVALLLLPALAQATIFTTPFGSFSALAAVASHADSVMVDGYRTCLFQFSIGAGTFTGNLEESLDAGGAWIAIGSPASVAADKALMLPTLGVTQFHSPVGLVRPALSACGACSIVVRWHCAK